MYLLSLVGFNNISTLYLQTFANKFAKRISVDKFDFD